MIQFPRISLISPITLTTITKVLQEKMSIDALCFGSSIGEIGETGERILSISTGYTGFLNYYDRDMKIEPKNKRFPRWRYHQEASSHLFWVRENLWIVEVHEFPKGIFSVTGKFSVSGCGKPERRFETLEDALVSGERRALERLGGSDQKECTGKRIDIKQPAE